MDIVVTGLHVEVPDRFRRHVEEKLAKVEQLSPRAAAHRREDQPRAQPPSGRHLRTGRADRQAKGPVIRAEACADDPYAALDLAQEKLLERLRRARDSRKVHHGRRQPASVRWRRGLRSPAMVDLAGGSRPTRPTTSASRRSSSARRPTRRSPMSVYDALDHMELVGPRLLPVLRHRDRAAERGLPPPRLELRRAAARDLGGAATRATGAGDRRGQSGAAPSAEAATRPSAPGTNPSPARSALTAAAVACMLTATVRPGRPRRGSGGRVTERIRVLVADDHVLYRRGLEMVLAPRTTSRSSARPATAPRPSRAPSTCCPTSS